MRCGLYGKLPAKRDYISVHAPGEFLGVWETWLETAIAASRSRLGAGWKEVYLRAPIWRFWLGAAHGGSAAAGAFMPSMDGVGRYFPLSVFALSDPGAAIPPPFLDPQDAFFEAVEDFLLATLATDTAFEVLRDQLDTLPLPRTEATELPAGVYRLAWGPLAVRLGEGSIAGPLAAMAAADPGAVHAHASVWWTLGGDGYPALGLYASGMPDPYCMTGMLTGRFGVQE